MADLDHVDRCLALAELGRSGTADWWRLVRRFSGVEGVFSAGDTELRDAGLNALGLRRLRGFDRWDELRRLRRRCDQLGISIVGIGSSDYPSRLERLKDPPLTIYYRGRAPTVCQPGVAIVGARRASRYGLRTAESLASDLAGAGLRVISGLARGIDQAAHRGALKTGRTAAVLANGLDRVYPRSASGLAAEIARSGCVLSEYPPGTEPLPYRFPVRNRIVTGLALATIVVEAGLASGSMVSAGLAADQGSPVFAVPGNIDSPASEGTNGLIRDGAIPVLTAEDVLAALRSTFEDLGISSNHEAKVGKSSPTFEDHPLLREEPQAAIIFALLESEARQVDDIIRASGLDGGRVMALLTALELEGLAEQQPGAKFARNCP